jgi:hypothetical protein
MSLDIGVPGPARASTIRSPVRPGTCNPPTSGVSTRNGRALQNMMRCIRNHLHRALKGLVVLIVILSSMADGVAHVGRHHACGGVEVQAVFQPAVQTLSLVSADCDVMISNSAPTPSPTDGLLEGSVCHCACMGVAILPIFTAAVAGRPHPLHGAQDDSRYGSYEPDLNIPPIIATI